MNKMNSIAFRLWIGINIILFIGTASFTTIYIWKESQSIEQAFKNEGITVVTTMSSVIATYMLQENYDDITPFANALLERPYIQYVIVRDKTGNLVNAKGDTISTKKILVQKVPITYFKQNFGEVEVGLHTDSIEKQKLELVRYSVALFFAISFLAMLLSSFLSRKLTAPIKNLLQATEDLANGKRNISVIEAGSIEMKELAKSFNQMAATIENHESKLVHEIEKATSILSEKIKIIEVIQKISHSVIGHNFNHSEAFLEIVKELKETINCEHLSIITWKLNENEEVQIYKAEENNQATKELLHRSFFAYDELAMLENSVFLNDEYSSRYPWIKVSIKSLLILPLITQEKPIGILCLGSIHNDYFDQVFLDENYIIYEQLALVLDMIERINMNQK